MKNVATVLGSIPASSDIVEFEGRQMNCWIKYIKKHEKNPPIRIVTVTELERSPNDHYMALYVFQLMQAREDVGNCVHVRE